MRQSKGLGVPPTEHGLSLPPSSGDQGWSGSGGLGALVALCLLLVQA